jgi:hypothetical protein
MACLIRLPAKRAMRYKGPLGMAVEDMVRYALRGIGLTEQALERYANSGRFSEWRTKRVS